GPFRPAQVTLLDIREPMALNLAPQHIVHALAGIHRDYLFAAESKWQGIAAAARADIKPGRILGRKSAQRVENGITGPVGIIGELAGDRPVEIGVVPFPQPLNLLILSLDNLLPLLAKHLRIGPQIGRRHLSPPLYL